MYVSVAVSTRLYNIFEPTVEVNLTFGPAANVRNVVAAEADRDCPAPAPAATVASKLISRANLLAPRWFY
jgi:hypothetical protein